MLQGVDVFQQAMYSTEIEKKKRKIECYPFRNKCSPLQGS